MSNRIASFVRYLRVSPFDGLTAEDRAAERYRRVVWSIAANVGSKALAMLVMLVTVRLTLSYLGSERFGVWITVSGFGAVLSFLDLGIGNALVNETARAAAKNDAQLLRQLVSNGLTIMAGIGLIAAMILIPVVCLFQSEMLFRNVDPSLHEEIRDGLLVFVALFAIGIPLQGVQRIAAGLQQAYLAHAVSAGASAVSLVLVVLLSDWKAPIPLLLCATYGTQVMAPLVLLVILYRRGLLGLPSGWSDMRTLVARLRGIGSLFLVLQVAVIAGWGMDNLVVSAMLGTSQVVALALVQKLYDLAYQPIAVFNAPLWAAYADALAHGDRNFVSSTLTRSMITTLLIALVAAGVIVVGNEVFFSLWLKSPIIIPQGLVIAFSVWFVLQAVGNAFSMYLNGAGIVRPQVATSVAFVALAFSAKILLVRVYGTTGIPAITAVTYVLAVVLPYLTVFRRLSLRPIIS